MIVVEWKSYLQRENNRGMYEEIRIIEIICKRNRCELQKTEKDFRVLKYYKHKHFFFKGDNSGKISGKVFNTFF
jgi:hypothetical protein